MTSRRGAGTALATALLAMVITVVPCPDNAAGASVENPKEVDRLLEQGRRAMVDKDYEKAIRIYTHLLQFPEANQDSLEYLALARERNGQIAHAKAEYLEYLRLYPDGEGADRVRQRLAALDSAQREPKAKRRKPRAEEQGTTEVDVFGSISQFYRRHQNLSGVSGTGVDLSSLFSDLFLGSQLRGEGYDVRIQASGNYDADFTEGGPYHEMGVSSAFAEASERRFGTSLLIGRQPRSTDGVLGRFDGVVLSWQALSKLKANALAGFPVEFGSLDEFQTGKYFYGSSLDIGTIADHWDMNVYFLNQMADGILDRRAVGGEVRFFHALGSGFSLVDYDISYRTLNVLQFVGNLFFPNGATVSTILDYRRSPFLTTTNALLGQPTSSVKDLTQSLSEREVRVLSEDRTATSRLATVSASYPIADSWQVAGDVTVTDLSGTPASGGVPGTDPLGLEMSYLAQVSGSNLIRPGDLTITSLRYGDGSLQDIVSLQVDSRQPMGDVWSVDPRVRIDYRMFDDGRHRIATAPVLRLENSWLPNTILELEGGLLWATDLGGGNDELGFIVNAGYRSDF